MPIKKLPILALLLALSPGAGSLLAGEPAPAATARAARIATMNIDAALARAREHLASRDEPEREILGVQFIPPHGRPGRGFWLVDLAPYPADRPAPADPFTSLLISMEGAVEERGGRRPLSQDEQKARAEKAANLQRLMRPAAEDR